MMGAIWQEAVGRPVFSPLRRDAGAEVLVIGGGLALLLLAADWLRCALLTVLLAAPRTKISRGFNKDLKTTP